MSNSAADAQERREPLAEDDSIELHELVAVLAERDFRLNSTLIEMLGEHFSHRTERRGCGYTQATRHLAVLVNQAPRVFHDVINRLFPSRAHAWEGLERTLLELPALLLREESRILAALITDLLVPPPLGPGMAELPIFVGEAKVGTCPLAEKYFLEVSDGFVRRKGRINVLVSSKGEPLLIEKINLGDNHSCVSVAEVMLNGVRLPPGCLFAVQRDPDLGVEAKGKLPGNVISVTQCVGFRFLRLTTLAVTPENRRRAFTTHFQSQIDAGLFAPAEVTVKQLRRIAEEQL